MSKLSDEELLELMFKVCQFHQYHKAQDMTDYVAIEIPLEIIPERFKEILRRRYPDPKFKIGSQN